MTIKEASELYGVSPQAIYKRLSKNGHDIKTLKTASGALTEEGEKLLGHLFDHTSVTGVGDSAPQQTRNAVPKKDNPLLLQAQKEVERLTALVDGLQKDVNYLTDKVKSLEEDKERLHRALDQSQQLQAMTMRMLPPAPAERLGVFAWLFSRFKKSAPAADQNQTEHVGNNQ